MPQNASRVSKKKEFRVLRAVWRISSVVYHYTYRLIVFTIISEKPRREREREKHDDDDDYDE